MQDLALSIHGFLFIINSLFKSYDGRFINCNFEQITKTMQSKTIALILLLLYKTATQGQTNDFNYSNIPEGYNKKFTANTEKNWDKKRIDAFIVDEKGNTYQGQLLYMNDNTLMLYASDTLFYKNPNHELIYKFSSDEVNRIFLNRRTRIGEGVIAGAVLALAAPIYATIEFVGTGEEGWLIILIPAVYLGAAMMTVPIGVISGYLYGKNIDYQTNGDSSSFKILSEELNKYTLFRNDIPEKYISEIKTPEQNLSPEDIPPYKKRKKDLLAYNKWDVGLSAGIVSSPIKDDVNSNIRNNLPSEYYKSSGSISNSISFDIGYRIHKNIRAGIEISGWYYDAYYENYDPVYYERPYTYFWFDYMLTSVALKCDYIYKPVRRLMSRRNEFSFGISYASNSMNSYVAEHYFINGSYQDPKETEAELSFNSQVNASLGYELYIFRFLSARMTLHGKYAINKLETAEIKITDVNNIEYNIPKTTINTSSVSAEFGLRLHF